MRTAGGRPDRSENVVFAASAGDVTDVVVDGSAPSSPTGSHLSSRTSARRSLDLRHRRNVALVSARR